MRITLVALTFMALIGCKVITNQPIVPKEDFPPDTKVIRGESQGQMFFDALKSGVTFDTLTGLWKGESYTADEMTQQQAWYFEGNQGVLLAQRCERAGVVAYAMTRAPMRIVDGTKIEITESHAYVATKTDPLSQVTISCRALLPKSQFYFKAQGLELCLSTGANCQGNKAIYEKIRDRM